MKSLLALSFIYLAVCTLDEERSKCLARGSDLESCLVVDIELDEYQCCMTSTVGLANSNTCQIAAIKDTTIYSNDQTKAISKESYGYSNRGDDSKFASNNDPKSMEYICDDGNYTVNLNYTYFSTEDKSILKSQ